jgi:hypothetical protein
VTRAAKPVASASTDDSFLEGEPDNYDANIPNPAPWPVLQEEALYGLPGEIVKAIEPHTEADRVAVLVNLLCAFGNAIGRGAHKRIGADVHHLRIYAALVGKTSKARKGTSWGYVRELMLEVDPAWAADHVQNGLSSGEGLIHAVRDPVRKENKKTGEMETVDEGVINKRLMVVEPELASTLKMMSRDGNTLSPVVRQAWDGDLLQVMTRNHPSKATDSHVSILGHITQEELLRHLNETEVANGFANRFLWLMVRRSKQLPFGGEWHEVDKAPLLGRLRAVLRFGKGSVEFGWGGSARGMWEAVYGSLSEGKPGLFGAVTGRAEAQVTRLAALYAVMDRSRLIEVQHLKAALALWEYAEESARYVFGDATGDAVADDILRALQSAGDRGMTRTEIRDYFGRNQKSERVNPALDLLLKSGRIRREVEPTGGRPVERWFLA